MRQQRAKIVHSLASAYGWTPGQILFRMPWEDVQDLMAEAERQRDKDRYEDWSRDLKIHRDHTLPPYPEPDLWEYILDDELQITPEEHARDLNAWQRAKSLRAHR